MSIRDFLEDCPAIICVIASVFCILGTLIFCQWHYSEVAVLTTKLNARVVKVEAELARREILATGPGVRTNTQVRQTAITANQSITATGNGTIKDCNNLVIVRRQSNE